MKEEPPANRIQQFAARLAREDVNMHGFLLTVDGEEKAAAYYTPFREGQSRKSNDLKRTPGYEGAASGIRITAASGR